MNPDKRKEITLRPQKVKFESTGRPAGLAKAHRMIMIEKSREEQLIRLSSQIRFDDKRKDRSDKQREDRKSKRRLKNSRQNN
jgi:hypothetical protein